MRIFAPQNRIPLSAAWLLLLLCIAGCGGPEYDVKAETEIRTCTSAYGTNLWVEQDSGGVEWVGQGALLASRFPTLEDFKKVVDLRYFTEENAEDPYADGVSRVEIRHCSNGKQITSILESGIGQKDISKVKSGGFWARLGLVFRSPFSVANRVALQRVYTLTRRRPQWFGEGDGAFYDLAEHMVAHINTPDLAFRNKRDSSEKGFINSFNHLTAQAFITTIFTEEVADFVADVHERKAMRELITGIFTPEQLSDPNNNPIDNYVDVVNNEWGQELGKELREKYGIRRGMAWTPELLANYLNELQQYYAWAFQIGMAPFRMDDEVVTKFVDKINRVLKDDYAGA
ncbi:MAG: hypothetical protein AAF570_07035 [Bacteroidota bacterium]